MSTTVLTPDGVAREVSTLQELFDNDVKRIIKGTWAMDSNSDNPFSTEWSMPQACYFCLVGGARRIYLLLLKRQTRGEYAEVLRKLYETGRRLFPGRVEEVDDNVTDIETALIDFNDAKGTTPEEILRLVKEANV